MAQAAWVGAGARRAGTGEGRAMSCPAMPRHSPGSTVAPPNERPSLRRPARHAALRTAEAGPASATRAATAIIMAFLPRLRIEVCFCRYLLRTGCWLSSIFHICTMFMSSSGEIACRVWGEAQSAGARAQSSPRSPDPATRCHSPPHTPPPPLLTSRPGPVTVGHRALPLTPPLLSPHCIPRPGRGRSSRGRTRRRRR